MKPYYDDGSCVIYHGDALEVLWDRAPQADLCTFDPPYNVGKNYDGYDDDRCPEDYAQFISSLLRKIDADTLTWFPGALGVLELLPLLGHAWTFRRLLAWHKKEYAGDVFHSGPAMCWEPIVWATSGPVVHNKVFGAWGRDLLVVNSTHGDPLRDIHPCPKPPEVLRWLIGLFCPGGGRVLDPTMGTGTALVQAKYLGRTAVGIEQSERYCEIAAKRLAQEVLPL